MKVQILDVVIKKRGVAQIYNYIFVALKYDVLFNFYPKTLTHKSKKDMYSWPHL